MAETKRFNLIIIGAGQAGIPLALKMAGQGKRVALIEGNDFGGTCTNTGCTPSKAYVASARRMWEATHGQELGVVIPPGARIDLQMVKARKDAIVKASVDSLTASLEENQNITLFRGTASFTGFKTIEVNGHRLFAEQIYINTGARATIPREFENIPFLTNETILELEVLPANLIIIGGSYLGLEFAQIFRRFGSRVTIVERKDRLASREDDFVSNAIREILEEEGIKVILNADCVGASLLDNDNLSVQVDCEEGSPQVEGTHVLLATGRTPNTGDLNLEATGLKTNDQGYIEVNDHLETIVAGIYALGDCNGKGAYTHTSYNDFEIITDNLLEGKVRKVSDRITTYCVYIDPPLARAGLTKKEALDKGYNILEASYPMNQVLRAREKGETKGFMTAVIDADTQKILGAAILGTAADEVISSLLFAMHTRMPFNMVRHIVFPHPTVSELLPAMLKRIES